ncbi:DUF7159 family protein [Mycobacterium haemophilum]|uniref:DUF7159 family protein n=1 Tax=Mycobacterium haemophilum TaxID=29311 RepID=UPI0009E207A5|nr:hypothetical protein [Mycobacterium haemophilum]
MDIVLGVSMAPTTVRMVLVEGESAGGVTVDQDNFEVAPESAAATTADQVVAAILGTRESAAESGYHVQSSGVTWTDPIEAAALRDALAVHKVENVMLVSVFVAAAALAQAVGSATNCARTALLFVEPTTATLAVVDSSDGAIADVRRRPLPEAGDAVVAELAAMVSGVAAMEARPESLFLVGSGVDIALLKPAVEASTSLSVTVPEEPEMALARGAALASANASLGAPPTIVMAAAQDPPTAWLNVDAFADSGVGELAYSAVPDQQDDGYLDYGARHDDWRSRNRFVFAMSALAVVVAGVVALALVLALGIRPHAEQRSSLSKNVVVPASQAPASKIEVPAPPSAVPAPVTEAPPIAPAPAAPIWTRPPQEEPPLRPREHPGWGHRRLGRGLWP